MKLGPSKRPVLFPDYCKGEERRTLIPPNREFILQSNENPVELDGCHAKVIEVARHIIAIPALSVLNFAENIQGWFAAHGREDHRSDRLLLRSEISDFGGGGREGLRVGLHNRLIHFSCLLLPYE